MPRWYKHCKFRSTLKFFSAYPVVHSIVRHRRKKFLVETVSVILTLKVIASQLCEFMFIVDSKLVSYRCSSISQKSAVTPRRSLPRHQMSPACAHRIEFQLLEYRMAERGGLIVLVLLLLFGCTMTPFYAAHSAVILTDYENIDSKCKCQRLLREWCTFRFKYSIWKTTLLFRGHCMKWTTIILLY